MRAQSCKLETKEVAVKEATYIHILIDALRKKDDILDQLIEHTKVQDIEISKAIPDRNRLDETFDQKATLINQLNLLDSGFKKVYGNLKAELDSNRKAYESDIKKLQEMIRIIVEKSTILQAMERQNQPKFQTLASSRKEIKAFKVSSQTASTYYKDASRKSGL